MFIDFLDNLKETKTALSWSSGYSGLNSQSHIKSAGLAVRETFHFFPFTNISKYTKKSIKVW